MVASNTALLLISSNIKISFQRKSSSIVLQFLLNLLKGEQCYLFIIGHSLPFNNVMTILIRHQNPFFVNFLSFDIAGEAVFEATTNVAFSLP